MRPDSSKNHEQKHAKAWNGRFKPSLGTAAEPHLNLSLPPHHQASQWPLDASGFHIRLTLVPPFHLRWCRLNPPRPPVHKQSSTTISQWEALSTFGFKLVAFILKMLFLRLSPRAYDWWPQISESSLEARTGSVLVT